jgi:hypothetical protein
VKATIGERTYRTRLTARRGQYRLPAGRARTGDEIEVAIELDRDPRVVAVPSDLAAALETAPDALHYFESLPHSRQRSLVRNVEGAKLPEIRERRIELAITGLRRYSVVPI